MNFDSANPVRVGAVIVAAGESRRMGGINKIFYPLAGKPLIWHSLAALNSHPQVDAIVLVVSESGVERANALVEASEFACVRAVCAGGARRQDSARIGVERLGDCDIVIVHDGARPFVGEALISKGIAAAMQSGAACAAVPVKDTTKLADCNDFVARTIPRQRLWAAQTPQVFKRALLAEAHRRALADATDDASMVEAIGYPVRLYMGSYYNIKITTPEDLTLAEAIIGAGMARGKQ